MLTENLDHVGPVRLPLDWGTHQVKKPRLDFYEKDGCHYLTALLGEITPDKAVLVRVQSACAFADIFGSCYCDCAWQFAEAKRRIFEAAEGLVVYCYEQHGKGIGLRNHYRVYAEGQPRDEKLLWETFERRGFSFENRHYDHVRDILKAMGVRRMKLMTNDPARLKTFTDAGFEVERQPLVPPLD